MTVTTIPLPRINANDDELLISEVLVESGQCVSVGDVLFVVESTKATEDVVSECDGYVRRVHAKLGEMVEVGSPLCLLTDTLEEDLPVVAVILEKTPGRKSPQKQTAKQRLSARRAASSGGPRRPGLRGRGGGGRLPPSGEVKWVKAMRGIMEEKCGSETGLAERTLVAGTLGSARGANATDGIFVEQGCQLGEGSRIVCRRLYMGRNVKVGSNVLLRADSVYLGAGVSISGDSSVVTGELLLEDGVRVGGGVLVDLAGGRSRDSRLIVGAQSLIAGGACVNTSREVVLGRRSAVSPRAMVFTHSFWQSVLDGYGAVFNSVRLCDNAWIGAGCQVLPGVTIGEGAVVMSNSTVVEDVAPHSLVGGVPAKMIRSRVNKELTTAEKEVRLRRLLETFAEEISCRGCVVEIAADQRTLRISRDDIGTRRVFLVQKQNIDSVPRAGDGIYVLLGVEFVVPEGGCVFDLSNGHFEGSCDRITHQLRNYFRRHGIRFTPFDWDADFSKGL